MLQLLKKMKTLQLRKKILTMILILSILSTLILSPSITSEASSYSAASSFTYTYQSYTYQFHYSGESTSPEGYSFDSSVLEYVINKSGEALNLAMAAGSGAKVNWLDSPLLYLVFSFYHNYVILTSKIAYPWVDSSCLYGFQFHFTGIDETYPGYELYGPAYGWSFVGWSGDQIDLVLDSSGSLFGSNPLGNYTFSDDQRDFGIWSDTQIDDGDIYLAENNSDPYQSLLAPYIQGDSLIFYLYLNGQPYKFELQDFANTYIGVHWSGVNLPVIYFYNASKSTISQYTLINHDNYPNVNFYIDSPRFYLDNDRAIRPCALLNFNNGGSSYPSDFILPNYYSQGSTLYMSTSVMVNSLGYYNSTNISGSYKRIFLSKLTTSPLPDPIVLPVNDPIPVSNIDPDPVVFDPDPEDDPDPVPGIDYPDPGPLPWPVPDIPPIVSGNDDLWPDLNLTFDIEDSLLDLTSNLGNFDWPEFSGLVGNFINALIWVSTIMTTLYEGTGFSVLFNVLAVFFIAAALFGLYKWWNK